jgi:uncharacterized protein (DUF4415 family)
MPKSKRALGSNLARLDATTDEEIARQIAEDPDTAPELTDEMLEEAELYEGDRFVRRVGRPKGSGKKELVTLRIDRDVLDRFRADGPGWQTRLNDTLRAVNEGGQIEEVRRKTFAEGYAMAIQAVWEQASRAAPDEGGSAPRGRARRRQRGTNAQMVEEILQAAASRWRPPRSAMRFRNWKRPNAAKQAADIRRRHRLRRPEARQIDGWAQTSGGPQRRAERLTPPAHPRRRTARAG